MEINNEILNEIERFEQCGTHLDVASFVSNLKEILGRSTPEGFVLIADNSKTIVAIEKMVEQQVEASGITQDVFRLDGHRILEAMIEAQE